MVLTRSTYSRLGTPLTSPLNNPNKPSTHPSPSPSIHPKKQSNHHQLHRRRSSRLECLRRPSSENLATSDNPNPNQDQSVLSACSSSFLHRSISNSSSQSSSNSICSPSFNPIITPTNCKFNLTQLPVSLARSDSLDSPSFDFSSFSSDRLFFSNSFNQNHKIVKSNQVTAVQSTPRISNGKIDRDTLNSSQIDSSTLNLNQVSTQSIQFHNLPNCSKIQKQNLYLINTLNLEIPLKIKKAEINSSNIHHQLILSSNSINHTITHFSIDQFKHESSINQNRNLNTIQPGSQQTNEPNQSDSLNKLNHQKSKSNAPHKFKSQSPKNPATHSPRNSPFTNLTNHTTPSALIDINSQDMTPIPSQTASNSKSQKLGTPQSTAQPNEPNLEFNNHNLIHQTLSPHPANSNTQEITLNHCVQCISDESITSINLNSSSLPNVTQHLPSLVPQTDLPTTNISSHQTSLSAEPKHKDPFSTIENSCNEANGSQTPISQDVISASPPTETISAKRNQVEKIQDLVMSPAGNFNELSQKPNQMDPEQVQKLESDVSVDANSSNSQKDSEKDTGSSTIDGKVHEGSDEDFAEITNQVNSDNCLNQTQFGEHPEQGEKDLDRSSQIDDKDFKDDSMLVDLEIQSGNISKSDLDSDSVSDSTSDSISQSTSDSDSDSEHGTASCSDDNSDLAELLAKAKEKMSATEKVATKDQSLLQPFDITQNVIHFDDDDISKPSKRQEKSREKKAECLLSRPLKIHEIKKQIPHQKLGYSPDHSNTIRSRLNHYPEVKDSSKQIAGQHPKSLQTQSNLNPGNQDHLSNKKSFKKSSWHDLPVQKLTEDVKREIQAMRLHRTLDPKTFIKGGIEKSLKEPIPNKFQFGYIIEGSSSSGHKTKKRSFVDSLMEDSKSREWAEKKFDEVEATGMKSGGKLFYKNLNEKRKKRK
ncbi:hypothetical protein O181_030273 [Austropuccinia psidii MF-1]|uniref:Fcf2 pre-rRNA processing C-terminal domain-containing protein n=1 Tax=Austropuccinia psidii MF-1 TaxID=1389203 RepID=A0A9Q3CXF4_9BASI|nr:hypothetical protein [Austropuccinia psidii MF-1]